MIDKMLHDPILLVSGGLFIMLAIYVLIHAWRNRH